MRSVAEITEEYNAVRAAYLKALEAESYSVASGSGSRSVSRPRVEALRKQMLELAAELERATRGGIVVRAGTPV